MPEKRLIHAHEDIESVVRFADSIGLLMLPEKLQDPDTTPWKPDNLRSFSRGMLLFYRPEWVMGDIELLSIKSGAFAGTYTVRGTNLSPIHIYFSGEKNIDGVRRLGDASVSFKRDWLAEPAHEIRLSPPDVEVVYKQLCKHLLSGVVARGGGHVSHVCKEAAELARRVETRPPFDYIEWPPPDLHKKTKR